MKAPKVGGLIPIPSEPDRIALANILFKHGYTVSTVRYKKDGKSYVYCVKYEQKPTDIKEEEILVEV